MISAEGLDKVMSAGLGRRYAFIGPIEVAYLNADGMYITHQFRTGKESK